MRYTILIILLALFLLPSCGILDEDTVVGSGIIGDRPRAIPEVNDSLYIISYDSWFEASLTPGSQEELLLGRNGRKYRFQSAVYFGQLSGQSDELLKARLTGTASSASGWYGTVRIERILESWSETSAVETLEVADDYEEVTVDPYLDIVLPPEWVRSWIDSSDGNNGVMLSLADDVEGLMRIPSSEADTTADGEPLLMYLTWADSAGAETIDTLAVSIDRFYAFKHDSASYVVDNEPDSVVIVGQRENMANQSIFLIDLPDSLMDVSINEAHLVLTVAESHMEEEMIELDLLIVVNDELDSDSIAVLTSVWAEVDVGEKTEGEIVEVPITDLAQKWIEDQDDSPGILLRSATGIGRDEYLVFYSADSPHPPRLKLLYTPLRQEGGAP